MALPTRSLGTSWGIGPAAFERLSLVTAGGIFILIVVGGVVRVTGAGLGCPDWPLCHGRAVPPLERLALTEYFHRLLVSLVGLLVLLTAFLAWRRHRADPWVVRPAAVALALLLVQSILGAAAVLGELDPAVVTAHLGLALLFLGSALVTALAARWGRANPIAVGERPRRGGFPAGVGAAAAATFVLMLFGAYIGTSGASLACPDWPLCQGRALPAGGWPTYVAWGHRLLAALATALILGVMVGAWRSRRQEPQRLALAGLASALVILQVLLGALNIWLRIPAPLVVLHLANGTLIWAILVTMLAQALRSPRRALQPAGAGA